MNSNKMIIRKVRGEGFEMEMQIWTLGRVLASVFKHLEHETYVRFSNAEKRRTSYL